MEIIKHDVAQKIEYFDLFDFAHNIKLSSRVLEHMEETNQDFDKYFQKLSKYDDAFVIYFWISLLYDEFRNSYSIESHNIKDFDFSMGNLFIDKLNISHKRIHDIHKFVLTDKEEVHKTDSYRKTPVEVSSLYPDHKEIFWYGAEPEDVKSFMDSFLEVYKSNSPSVLNSNPFLKSALIHLLFLKIHPYTDGNGRTARLLHNIKFTEIINKIYGMKLKISPVNISESINLYKYTYIKGPDNIYFDLDHDNSGVINFWFNWMLNMYDEQLYKNQNLINNIDDFMEIIFRIKERINPETIEQIENMHVRRRK